MNYSTITCIYYLFQTKGNRFELKWNIDKQPSGFILVIPAFIISLSYTWFISDDSEGKFEKNRKNLFIYKVNMVI